MSGFSSPDRNVLAGKIQNNGVQSIPNAAWTKLQLSTLGFADPGVTVDLVANYWVVFPGPNNLIWAVGHVIFAANVTGLRGLRITSNAGTFVWGELVVPANTIAAAPTLLNLASWPELMTEGKIDLYCYQSSGAALNTSFGGLTAFKRIW